jgi:hypothetical protein
MLTLVRYPPRVHPGLGLAAMYRTGLAHPSIAWLHSRIRCMPHAYSTPDWLFFMKFGVSAACHMHPGPPAFNTAACKSHAAGAVFTPILCILAVVCHRTSGPLPSSHARSRSSCLLCSSCPCFFYDCACYQDLASISYLQHNECTATYIRRLTDEYSGPIFVG